MNRIGFLKKLALVPAALVVPMLPKQLKVNNKKVFTSFGFAPGSMFYNTSFNNCVIRGKQLTFHACAFAPSTTIDVYDSRFIECSIQGTYIAR